MLLVAALLLVSFGSLGKVTGPQMFDGGDKLIHLITYAVLYVLAWLAFPGPALRWRLHLTLLAFGVMIELAQGQITYRFMEGADILANVAGTGVGNLILPILLKRLPGALYRAAISREQS